MSEEAFERVIAASPDDDTARLVYADWLEERADPRGELLRAWFALRGASFDFTLALAATSPGAAFSQFGVHALRYWQAATLVDRAWLWRLGTGRPWVYGELGLLLVQHTIWQQGRNWLQVAEQQGSEMERAWAFRSTKPVLSSGRGLREYPPWYLVHKFLGSVGLVGSAGPKLALWVLEGRP
jgi:uncharacterized protein (TIGR02996 family)